MLKTLSVAALVAVAVAAPARAATQITVENIGSVLNESLALPAEDTPGSGIGFEQFFEFTLPVTETVTVSVSDSAIGAERIVGGVLSLNNWTSNAPVSPFQPIGLLIESSSIANVIGGQEATVAPDALHAGDYFAEVAGVSGGSPTTSRSTARSRRYRRPSPRPGQCVSRLRLPGVLRSSRGGYVVSETSGREAAYPPPEERAASSYP